MPIEKIHIDQFLELAKKYPVIDVRSPAEYQHAHIPGAYNLPLFSDEERKIVGTAYKQESREKAIKLGLDFFGPKMRRMVEEVEGIVSSQQSAAGSRQSTTVPDCELPTANCILLYCWRGGMRSAGIAWLLDLYGFKVYTLIGGYKKFRRLVLDTFELPFQFKIIGGYTGSGKTDLLKTLKQNGELVVDLEDIAKHKGSAFGSIGMPGQPGQEMFENLLAMELRSQFGSRQLAAGQSAAGQSAVKQSAISSRQSESSLTANCPTARLPTADCPTADCLWLEDESQRIGLVNIPKPVWENMRRSPVYFLDIPFEERLKYIIREYGQLDKQRVLDAIDRIRVKLGGLNAKNASQLLEEGNTAESFNILLQYYDKLYFKALHNREGINSLLHVIPCKSITPENASQLVRQSEYQPQTP